MAKPSLKSKASRLAGFGRRKGGDSSEEQVFSQKCSCGKAITRPRHEESQLAECDHCGRIAFVLPINTYPAPRRVKPKKKKRESEPAEPLMKRVSQVAGRAGQSVRNKSKALGEASSEQVFGTWQAVRKWWTPLRMAVAALLVVLIGFGWYSFLQQQSARALVTLRESVQLAEEAVDAENFTAATEAYHNAAEAVKTLGRTDRFALEILQKDREWQTLSNLCLLPLNEILLEASDPIRTDADWESYFGRQIEDRWLVLETWLEPHKGGWRVSEPIAVGEERVGLYWPTSVSGLRADDEQKNAIHVLIAGQVDTLVKEEKSWRMTMQGDSAFLWCFEESLAPLGFELETPWNPQDSLKAVLKRQQLQILGAEE